TAHRPLSAVWLLMSVVLAAAYQGLLLRELTSPPGEINSLEQLEQSGLDVVILKDLREPANDFLPTSITSRARYIPWFHLHNTIENISEGHHSALICYWDMMTAYKLLSLLLPSKRVHTFSFPYYYPKAVAMFTKGSPLCNPLMSATGRALSGGLYDHLFSECLAAVRRRGHVSDPESGDQLTRPLSLAQLLPAFVVLAAGHLLG
ncbi:Ionotropic receptor 211, partial [Frankliniella occidentalis]